MLDVLLADDDAVVRECIAEALRSAGHRVTQAADGEEAASLISAHEFDVAICDIAMPKLDGLTLATRIRRDAPATSVIVMTSFGDRPGLLATEHGAPIDFVLKPFDPDHFTRDVICPLADHHAVRRRGIDALASFALAIGEDPPARSSTGSR